MEHVQLAKSIRTAIKAADIGTVKSLLASNPSLLHAHTPFGTWLHVACKHGQLPIVQWLVEGGLDINVEGGLSGGRPLNEAVSGGHLPIVEYLLSKHALMDTSVSERNPLFTAIYNGNLAIAKRLIDAGIDTNVAYTGSSMQNMDAIAFAREWGRNEIVELIEMQRSA